MGYGLFKLLPFSLAYCAASRYSTSLFSSSSSLLPTRTITRSGEARARASVIQACKASNDDRLVSRQDSVFRPKCDLQEESSADLVISCISG